MEPKHNNGGPAFPATEAHGLNTGDFGMTMRDYFAAKAMQGICASGPGHHMTNGVIAAEAYSLADAMLAERAKVPA